MHVIHDHIQRTLSSAFLDDKDAIVVDNYTAAGPGLTTGTNTPRDGKDRQHLRVLGPRRDPRSDADPGGEPVDQWRDQLGHDGHPDNRYPERISERSVASSAVAPSGRLYMSFFVYALTGPNLTHINRDRPLLDLVGQPRRPGDVCGADQSGGRESGPNHLQDPDTFRNLSCRRWRSRPSTAAFTSPGRTSTPTSMAARMRTSFS